MRVSYEEADKYGSSGGGSFFKVENDMEIKRVRLLGRDMNDFPGYACHEVYIGEKRKLVNCLREYNDPVDVCPFCAARKKVIVKVFIPVFNIADDEIQVWERGKGFFPELSGYVSRHKNVVSYITEVERHGKPKDTNTTYKLYAVDDSRDETTLEDFEDEMPEILGRYILDKTAEEMEYFLDHKSFPEDGSDESSSRREEPVTRRSARRSRRSDEEF